LLRTWGTRDDRLSANRGSGPLVIGVASPYLNYLMSHNCYYVK